MFRGYKKMMPREKMQKFGSSQLDEKELIAILLRTGSKDLSVIDLAEKTLKDNNYSLCKLHNLPLEELRKTKGMGEVKALTIKAALELGQRYHHEKLRQKNKISHPSDIYSICQDMEFLDQEVVRVICLDSKNTVIAVEDVTKGINNASLNFNNSSSNGEQANSQQQNRQNERKANEEYNYFDNEEKNEEIISSLEIVVPHYA